MTNGNDYILPIVLGDSLPNGEQHNRLTKREYFSAMAMQGLLASGQLKYFHHEDIVTDSRLMADALINELNKPQ